MLNVTTTDVASFSTQGIINFVCLFTASVFFGGNYLPVKHFETGDGYFFQLIVCIGIWLSSLAINWYKNNPQFYALPILGGLIWSSGNVNSVPIIKCLGIGFGSLFWNIIGLLAGWGNARYGWFGVKPQIPSNVFINYLGVAFCVASIILFLFVDVEMDMEESNQEIEPLINRSEQTIQNSIDNCKKLDVFDRMSVKVKRIVGTILSIFTGAMFGLSLTPILYLVDNYPDVSPDYNMYAFSYSTGILLGSLIYFVIYCIIKKNRPDVYPESILPGLAVGLVWQIANTCFFVATSNLDQEITFPVVNCGPCAVAFIIGLLYKEIKGRKNFILIFIGIMLTVTGSILCSLSK